MCHPAAPIEIKRRSMLVHSVRRVPPPRASSSHRISKPPQLYSSTLGASARVTVVSETCSVGAPSVVSFTVVPAVVRLPSASKGAHSRRCAGSVSACQTFSGEWRSSLTRMSVHFSSPFCPRSFRICAPRAGPGVYCSRSVIYRLLHQPGYRGSVPAALPETCTEAVPHARKLTTRHIPTRVLAGRSRRYTPLTVVPARRDQY